MQQQSKILVILHRKDISKLVGRRAKYKVYPKNVSELTSLDEIIQDLLEKNNEKKALKAVNFYS